MNYSNHSPKRPSYGHEGGGRPNGSQSYNRERNQSGRQNDQRSDNSSNNSPKEIFEWASFKSSWITDAADSNLPTFAETVGAAMATGFFDKKQLEKVLNGELSKGIDSHKLTKSKIRSIYGEIKRIQIGKFENNKAAFYLLRPKVAYALGRDSKNCGLKLFKLVFDKASGFVDNEKSYENFCNLMEAILAYHKAYGGKD